MADRIYALTPALLPSDDAIGCDAHEYGPGSLLVFRRAAPAVLRARGRSRVMLLGGAALDGARHIWWNFVSSSSDLSPRGGAPHQNPARSLLWRASWRGKSAARKLFFERCARRG